MFDFATNESVKASKSWRVLSISGGGLLGVIPAAVLLHYETLGRGVYGRDYRISDSFDLVGGSSTGAVIATGVALGLSAAEIANFYLRDVPKGFKRRWGAVPLLHDVFDGDLMQKFFLKRTGGRCLSRDVLACDLAVTVKDLTQSRPIVFSTLPAASVDLDMGDVDHRQDALPLDLLLRASTAAPGLFSPVALTLETGSEILAADGGLGPFNDPSLLLARLAWAFGADHVDLTALGTGSTRPCVSATRLMNGPAIARILSALAGVIKDGEAQTREVLSTMAKAPGAPLTYTPVNMGLDRATFEGLGLNVSDKEISEMRNFSKVAGKCELFAAALEFAEQKIFSPLPLCNANLQTAVV